MVPTNELEDLSPRARTRKIVIVALLAALSVAAIAYGVLSPARDASGGEAPEFELELLNQSGTLSSSELKGSPVVINFFASWCVPCREEAPLLQKEWEEHRAEGVRVVGVSIRDAASDARKFADRYGITYPLVHDPQEVLAGPIGVLGLPETYFIDADWRFAGAVSGKRIGDRQGTVWFGPISEEALEENLATITDR